MLKNVPDKIKILLEYMEKEIEINKNYDEEDGIDVNSSDYCPSYFTTKKRLESFINYKEIRVKQHWHSVISNKLNVDKEKYAITANKFDRERRMYHNAALESVIGFNYFAKKYNLQPIYEGELLTSEEIEKHNSKDHEKRMKMTDFFLELLNDIENFNIELTKDKSIEDNFLLGLKSKVEKIDRDYEVQETLTSDDGVIKVKDELR